MPPVPVRRHARRHPFRDRASWSSSAAHAVDEEAQAEDAVDDRGMPARLLTRDADHADQHALPGVFAQVDAGQHAQGKAGDRHQEDQHHGAEDRGKQAALGVRFAGIAQQQFPDLGQRSARSWPTRPIAFGW